MISTGKSLSYTIFAVIEKKIMKKIEQAMPEECQE